MKWLRRLPEWAVWLCAIVFGSPLIVLVVVLVLGVGGCATPQFDGPLPAPFQSPAEYRKPWNKDNVPCWYVHENARWWMNVPRNECVGWEPL